MNNMVSTSLIVAAALALTACGGSSNNTTTTETPDIYEFESKFVPGSSSHVYTGQIGRQVMISKLKETTSSMMMDDVSRDFLGELIFFYDGGSSLSNAAHGFTVSGGETVIPGPLYSDIGSASNLDGKIAGNDTVNNVLDFSATGGFIGIDVGFGVPVTPEEQIREMFDAVDAQGTDSTTSLMIQTVSGLVNVDTAYIDSEGRDYVQLIQKFLLGAVNFHQATDDYFSGNSGGSAGNNTWADLNKQRGGLTGVDTEAEHDWDEAFGYFGAARNYDEFTDDEIAGSGGRTGFENGYNDANGDGSIDLLSEFNFGASVNCAKRDRGSTTGTNLTGEAFDAFFAGRQLLNDAAADAPANLTAEQVAELEGYIKTAAVGWEKCIAATAIHYINDVISDMGRINASDQYVDLEHFEDLAKHWGEMVGFTLSLQFSPFSPFRDPADTQVSFADLQAVLADMGNTPVLASDGAAARSAYETTLLGARDTLQSAYGFADADVENW